MHGVLLDVSSSSAGHHFCISCEMTSIRVQHWFLIHRKCSLAHASLPGHYSLGRCLVNTPSEWYCDKPIPPEIINPATVPLHEQHRPDFIFMDDNAPPHRGHIIRERLLEAGVPQVEWSALSPDLNPIENLWDLLSRHGEGHNPALKNLNDLRAALQEE
ncbi:2, 5 -phosphodiesterase 12-like protein [Labeo rohita]|uniref:2, 5-phosphodiesterase 12-like protein n=1 Tax=Labeo rohita TaxID=84645 RepID=A0A498MHK8_LABRO|nr:2, 5 -phosphodiesterase 12-like protein [Labeo rohita]RXN32601.1 2, 5 -phosphodiesterase 12-like protein [Labeo rohita]